MRWIRRVVFTFLRFFGLRKFAVLEIAQLEWYWLKQFGFKTYDGSRLDVVDVKDIPRDERPVARRRFAELVLWLESEGIKRACKDALKRNHTSSGEDRRRVERLAAEGVLDLSAKVRRFVAGVWE